MNASEIRSFMAGLHGAWPNTEIDEATVLVWSNALAPIEWSGGQAALKRLIDTLSRFPTVADLNAELTQMRREERRRDEMDRRPLAEPMVNPRDGVKVALAAYRAECEKGGRQPNPQIVAGWLNGVGLSR